MSRYRYDIYSRTDLPYVGHAGTKLIEITDQIYLKGTGWRQEYNGTGSGQLIINRHHAACTSANFADGNYVLVVDTVLAKNIAGFFLPRGTVRLLSSQEAGDENLTINGQGSLSYLGRAVWWNESYVAGGLYSAADPRDDGQWRWQGISVAGPGGPYGEQYGDILHRAIDEAQSNPNNPLPAITMSFGHIYDTGGAAWDSWYGVYRVPIGRNYIDFLIDVLQLGLTVQMSPLFRMDAYQGDHGTVRTSTTFASGKVRFAGGVNIPADLDRSMQPTARVKHILVKGASTNPDDMVVVTDSGAPWESQAFVESGDVANTDQLTALGNKEIALRGTQTDIAMFPILLGNTPLSGIYTPSWPGDGGHFWLGDIVTIHTGSSGLDYNNEALRVAAISATIDEAGNDVVMVELGASFTDFSHPGIPASTTPGVGGCTCPLPAIACAGGSGELAHWDFSYIHFEGPGDPSSRDVETDTIDAGCYAVTTYYPPADGAFGSGYGRARDGGSGIVGGLSPGLDYTIELDIVWEFDPTVRHPSWEWRDGSDNVIGSPINLAPDSYSIDTEYHLSQTLTAPAGTAGGNFKWSSASFTYVDNMSVSGPTDALCGVGAYDTGIVTYGPTYVQGSGGYIPGGSTIVPPTAAEVPFTPTGTIAATDVQAAIAEVAAEATTIFGTPAIALGASAAAGSISEAIRRDSTIVAFDATAPVTQAFSDTAATGSAAVAARRDHKHGMPAGSSATVATDVLWDAKGDLAVGTGADTAAKLPVGADAQVPVARSAAGSGIAWEDRYGTVELVFNGQGGPISTGIKGDWEVPYALTLVSARLFADLSGSIVVDIWKDTYANYPPTVADTITASAKPTLSAATKSQDTTLTGWTTACAAGDVLRFNIDSAATVTRATLSLRYKQA